MAEFDPKKIFRNGAPASEVWGSDWTRDFDPNEVIPGALLIDPPYPKVGERVLRESDILNATSRESMIVDETDFQELAARVGIPETKLICFSAIQRFTVHNQGTKFGERDVVLVTPVIVNGDRFMRQENLTPYFVYEQNLTIADGLSHLFTPYGLSPEQLEAISQKAKTQAMKYALIKGDLAAYLAFHDFVYPTDSKDQDVRWSYDLKTRALEIIGQELTPALYKVTHGLLGFLGVSTPALYEVWQRQIWKRGFSFKYLNEPVK